MITISIHVKEAKGGGDVLLSMEASEGAGDQPAGERAMAAAVLRFLQAGIMAGELAGEPVASIGFEDKKSASAVEMRRKMMEE